MDRNELVARYDAGERNFHGADLRGANLSRTDLRGANLSDAYLSRANLRGANLSGAYLSDANLSRANLRGANLSGAHLSGADLSRADLSRADLSGADLSRADLSRADLSGAHLTEAHYSLVAVLAASWGKVSPTLCHELMRWDASAHPYPEAFEVWAAGGACPLETAHVGRLFHFQEQRELYTPGYPTMTLWELWVALAAEKDIRI